MIEQEEDFYEQPAVALERLRQLQAAATGDISAVQQMLVARSGQE